MTSRAEKIEAAARAFADTTRIQTNKRTEYLAPFGGQDHQAQADAFKGLLGAIALPPDEPQAETSYPCSRCGKLRTKAEGGTTFTVCEACWLELEKEQTLADPPKPAEPSCGTCRFFDHRATQADGDKLGHCHRYPLVRTESGTKNQPDVADWDWCGEWKPREGAT